ncbi:hypothetical protein ACIA8O_22160 [Kitasatospora sp. NPDC051853]|uniref:hypothetical protein n=1 Tax=Kitasatospora sp. NPDC051853 TaxID=3364058 RepID=UPI0037A2085F
MHPSDARKVFAGILRAHGLDPEGVGEVGRAWDAFREFVQVPLGGLVEDDGDGFIVQWGRWSWHDGRPSLGFSRQLGLWEDGEVELWSVELTLFFDEDPAWAGLGNGDGGTGFRFDPVGDGRGAALDGIAASVGTVPEVAALWRAAPVGSALGVERVC